MFKKNLFLASFLLANAFTWYYMIRNLLNPVETSVTIESILVNGTFFTAVIVSSLLGAALSKKTSIIEIVEIWMIFGCITAAIPFLFSPTTTSGFSILALLFGLSFGIGMPSCLTFFADLTNFENRGILSGTTFLVTNLVFIIITLFSSSLTTIIIASLVWRAMGLCMLLTLKPASIEPHKEEKAYSPRLVFQNRVFVLYAIPWLIFSLVDQFTKIYAEKFFEPHIFESTLFTETVIGIIFVFLGGLLADYFGRKRIVTYGFVALGLGYAFIGLAPYTDISRYFYTFVDGIAWGIFMVIYMLVLWKDVSPPRQASEWYYALGSIPFFLSSLLGLVFKQYIQGISEASAYAIFSIAAFFLFLAVLPLMYAPETLPEKKMKDRELKQYIEKARKTKEKYA